MEYFLLRRERDLLLKAKLSSLEHLLVADRVRSFAILAEGLSAQVRNTMTALQAYIELAAEQSGPSVARPAVSVEQRLRNLQWETEDAGRHLLKVVQGIAAATIETRHAYDDRAELGTFWRRPGSRLVRSRRLRGRVWTSRSGRAYPTRLQPKHAGAPVHDAVSHLVAPRR